MTTATKTARANNTAAGPNTDKELAKEVEGLRKDLAALADRFSKIGDAGYRAASDLTAEKTAAARHRGEAIYADVSERAGELEQQVTASIRRHPLQSLALAAGIGFLAALVTRR